MFGASKDEAMFVQKWTEQKMRCKLEKQDTIQIMTVMTIKITYWLVERKCKMPGMMRGKKVKMMRGGAVKGKKDDAGGKSSKDDARRKVKAKK